MRLFLSKGCALKLLETPSVYHINKDELYELDTEAFEFLRRCSGGAGCVAGDPEFIGYCLNEGILTGEKPETRRPPIEQSPYPSLRYLELQITDRCNLKCRHCYIGDAGGDELTPSAVKTILDEFERMQGLRVLITGGEPLIHPGFDEINALLRDYALRKVLFTNGLLLNKKILKALNVHEIQISIDGLENGHDALRGKGSYPRAMRGLRAAIEAGFEVSVSTMVHSRNLNDFEAMEKSFRETAVKDWTVDVPCASGRLAENPMFGLDPSVAGKYLKYGYGEGPHVGAEGFGCGLHLMSVDSKGRCAKCTFYSGSPAGRREDGLKECWSKIKPVRLEDLDCRDCGSLALCRGGCRYRASLSGGPSGKDLYRCSLYDRL